MSGERIPAHLSGLSDDAKAVAGGHFGFMQPGKGTLTFKTPSRMTERGKAALDELVAAGVCTVEPFNQLDGLVYRPVINCRPFARWLMRNEAAGRFAMVKSDSSSTEEACP
ncbi:hypothetical protein [Methylobacterium nodulans]|uniref:Uncharacterized protein n=1 Tax=Methylobacterium nodulans (strain LMG 21967 / CNCM I-2342 / ORS 2060) TaxID=460265 RepID=B8INZ3_METNO|nr:hypothetical protein [Methylobacterium nodulans]ACL58509.1 hypothetical protein Mnod_3600 [Methylobacterium nodulans ORS 2060]